LISIQKSKKAKETSKISLKASRPKTRPKSKKTLKTCLSKVKTSWSKSLKRKTRLQLPPHKPFSTTMRMSKHGRTELLKSGKTEMRTPLKMKILKKLRMMLKKMRKRKMTQLSCPMRLNKL
jgi:hypothetical protein